MINVTRFSPSEFPETENRQVIGSVVNTVKRYMCRLHYFSQHFAFHANNCIILYRAMPKCDFSVACVVRTRCNESEANASLNVRLLCLLSHFFGAVLFVALHAALPTYVGSRAEALSYFRQSVSERGGQRAPAM